MGRRLSTDRRSGSLPARAPRDMPTRSPSAYLPEPVIIQEQPSVQPEFPCPAWPLCTASFRDEREQRHHIRRHAHAQRR